ncbi:tRNA-dihydrouridine synthase, partial [Candidatus Woesearchaeota archaeon]|nr:tRNA-dihydrouridine synthase [Candidatus Woesearchaeota archaeon]
GCDGIMVGRESKYKPWMFTQQTLDNNQVREQIFHFIDLYEKNENRFSLDEIKDHCFRLSRDFKTDMDKRKLKSLSNLKQIKEYIKTWK